MREVFTCAVELKDLCLIQFYMLVFWGMILDDNLFCQSSNFSDEKLTLKMIAEWYLLNKSWQSLITFGTQRL